MDVSINIDQLSLQIPRFHFSPVNSNYRGRTDCQQIDDDDDLLAVVVVVVVALMNILPTN